MPGSNPCPACWFVAGAVSGAVALGLVALVFRLTIGRREISTGSQSISRK
jgi:hypothetical protein